MLVRQVIQDATGMSRRQCFGLFRDGKVFLNDVVCENFKNLCQAGDFISRNNGRLHTIAVGESDTQQTRVILFHKPVGYVVSRSDRFNPTIYSLLPSDFHTHYRPIGRLDKESSGLLLLMNDGDLSHAIAHPTTHVTKSYRVTLDRPLTGDDADRLLHGEQVGMFDPQDTHIDMLRVASLDGVGSSVIYITLTEGKKRHIRRLLRHVGYCVQVLERVSIGGLSLGSLAPGEYRFLSEKEIVLLRDVATDAP